MPRTLRRAVFLFIALATFVCAGMSTTLAQEEKVLNAAFSTDYHTFGPPFYFSTPDWPTNASIYNHLLRFVPGEPMLEPDLAERWEVSEDGLTYTFYLREGVQFHHGYGELTSEDVAFVFQQMQDPEIGENYATRAQEIREIEIVDRYTIRFHMASVQPDFLAEIVAFPGFIYSKRAFEELGVDGMREQPVGTGAYTVESWRKGEEVVFRAHDEYFRGRPAIDKVVLHIIPEETVTVLSMLQGDIDYAILRQADGIELAMSSPGLEVEATPILGFRAMWLNINREPFDDVRVRQAISHAVDRETLVGSVLNNQATLEGMWSSVPPGIFGHNPNVAEYHYDPERARELLAEAGYPDGLDIDIQYRVSDRPAVEALQGMLADVGVRATLQEVDPAQFFELVASGNWSTSISGPSRTVPDAFLAFYHSTNRPLYYGLLDADIEAQSAETDPDRRREMLWEIQEKIAEDAPNIPLFRPLYVTVARPGVTGDVPNSHFWLWYFELVDFAETN